MPDDDFVIGEPVEELPSLLGGGGRGRYRVIFARLEQLEDGKWLPVECKDKKDAGRLASSAFGSRTRKISARIRDKTVYLRIEKGAPRRS